MFSSGQPTKQERRKNHGIPSPRGSHRHKERHCGSLVGTGNSESGCTDGVLMAGLRQAVYHETPSEPPEELEPWYRIPQHLVVQRTQHQNAGRFCVRRDSDPTSNLTAYDAALPSISPVRVCATAWRRGWSNYILYPITVLGTVGGILCWLDKCGQRGSLTWSIARWQ
jgi:hypothetical protein